MNILVVNDDGIDALGIKILANHLKKYGNVVVVAPDRVRSASSHSIIIRDSISFIESKKIEGIKAYQISGMPADCVRLGLSLLNVDFDIVFSGINDGLNLATDVFYSGTVGAAREAMFSGLPSVSISTDFNCFDIVNNELDSLLDYVFKNKLYSKEYVLNINFPNKGYNKSLGYRFTKQGIKLYRTTFVEKENSKFIEGHSVLTLDSNKDSDVSLGKEGYITFVPLGLDQTSNYLGELRKYDK